MPRAARGSAGFTRPRAHATAVKTQIWIAFSVYLPVGILKKELKINRSLEEILQILSITLFEKVSMNQALKRSPLQQEGSTSCKQLILLEF